MILIFSNKIEYPTAQIILWLNHFNTKWFRVNYLLNENNQEQIDFNFCFNNKFNSYYIKQRDVTINLNDVKVVWFRRLQKSTKINQSTEFPLPEEMISSLTTSKFMEKDALMKYMVHFLKNKFWLSHPETANINKLFQLTMAEYCKLNIPRTIIATRRTDVEEFMRVNNDKKLITKAIQNIHPISDDINKTYYSLFANVIDENTVSNIPEIFFPSLFQQYIEKDLEIRSFYLDGKFFSCAMFTQMNTKTQIDFRRYDYKNPTRRVPYKLPDIIEKRLDRLMRKLGLNTGSIDILFSEGKYYFLEVNPVGQFGVISHPCNYYIDKEIANFLKLKSDG